MILLYPQKFPKLIKLGPNNSHLLIYGIRINSKKEGKFNIKSIFKTMILKQGLSIKLNI
jgi:hypothetical protein